MGSTLDEMLKEFYPNYSPNKLQIYKNIAVDKILNYFTNNLKITITADKLETEYESVLFLMVSNAIDFEESKGLKSVKQGNKQVSFNTYDNKQFVLTDEMKSMLPLPRVVFKGWLYV